MSNEDLHDRYLNTLLELNHEKLRREAFEKDVEMHKKMTRLLADRAAETIVERDRLKAEVERLISTIGAQAVELDDLRARLRK